MDVCKHLIAASLTLAAATSAAAGTADFEVVTGNGYGGIDLSVTIQDSNLLGYDYEFVIENNTQVDDAVVTGFYFESGWANLLSSNPLHRNLNLGGAPLFGEAGLVPNIAGWTESLVSYEAMDQQPSGGLGLLGGLGNLIQNLLSGLGIGQSATVAFTAQEQTTLADLELALGSQGYGIGLQIQGLSENDPSESTWALTASADLGIELDLEGLLPDCPPHDNGDSTPVPTPSAAVMGLALIGLALKRRRRND